MVCADVSELLDCASAGSAHGTVVIGRAVAYGSCVLLFRIGLVGGRCGLGGRALRVAVLRRVDATADSGRVGVYLLG